MSLELDQEVRRLRRINAVLMDRVEAGPGGLGDTAYGVFERAMLLESVVRQRTGELDRLNEDLAQAVKEMHGAHERLKRIAAQVPGALMQYTCDEDGRVDFTYVSQGTLSVFGRTPEQVLTDSEVLWSALHRQDRQRVLDEVREHSRTLKARVSEYRVIVDDSERWVSARAVPARDADGEVVWYSFVCDVTERVQADAKLRLLQTAVESAANAVVITDAGSRILWVNRAFTTLTGYESDEVIGKMPSILRSGMHDGDFYRDLWTTIRDGRVWNGQLVNRHKDGSTYHEQMTITPVLDDRGRPTHYIAVKQDVTQQVQASTRLHHLATRDPLTGLFNRDQFSRLLDESLQRRDESDQRIAIMFLDLDRFKLVNDSLGHELGDAMLQATAQRLLEFVGDRGVVSRFGGDEFAILLPRVHSDVEAEAMASRMIEKLGQAIEVEGHEMVGSGSAGVVVLEPDQQADAASMLRDADTAMYHAKDSGRACVRLFDQSMREEVVTRQRLEAQLRQRRWDAEFEQYYQPIIDLSTGTLTGFEALMRWRPEGGAFVPPDQFIAIAEEIGLIHELGEWGMRQGCRELRRWLDRFPDFAHTLDLKLNLSRRQVGEERVVWAIQSAAAEFGIEPRQITLEVTESAMLDGRGDARGTLEQLRELGYSVAMDDFGTGESSLSSLCCLPIDIVKIDRNFVWRMSERREMIAVVQAVVALTRSMNMALIAEGVETEEHVHILQAMDCGFAQGYFFGKPMPGNQAAEFIARQIAQGSVVNAA